MANERCAKCGLSFALFGRVHRCIPIAGVREPTEPDHVPLAQSPPQSVGSIAGMASGPRETTTYRYRDPVKRREQMRDLMRRKRAKAKQ